MRNHRLNGYDPHLLFSRIRATPRFRFCHAASGSAGSSAEQRSGVVVWKRVQFADLPLVLCGPMLRRVDPHGVTVFLALRDPRTVTLRGYRGAAGTAPVCEGTAWTIPLGAHLHVVAVTASGPALSPGTLHLYQVFFGPHATDGMAVPATAGTPTLFTDGVVEAAGAAARGMLLYAGAGNPGLPSFVTPPSDPGTLRLVHASCLKPHGGGIDVLPEVDSIVAGTVVNPARRPHQLLLTGDQIYADDVADPLLAAIRPTMSATLGMPTERLPNAAGDGALSFEQRRTGHRGKIMREEARFSAEEKVMKSHLMSFAEFAGMYLMFWSDKLWPQTLPTFDEVYPDERKVLGQEYDAIMARGSVGGSYGRTSDDQHPALDALKRYLEECQALLTFKGSRKAVRRLLANAPTLTILDDHEITDDWNMTLEWSMRVLLPPPSGSALGRRVVQNGLLAYAVFQGWGNTPDRFAPTGTTGEPGRALLALAAGWDGTNDANGQEIGRRLALPTAFSSGAPVRPAGALTYHYTVTWPGYQLVVLDTRTWRGFPGTGRQDAAALIYGETPLQAMLSAPGDLGPNAVTVVVSAAPIVDVPLVEETVKPAAGKLMGRYYADLESWAGRPEAYHGLLPRLFLAAPKGPDGKRRRRVVVLSGDVHYGFAALLRYSATRPLGVPAPNANDPVEGVMAQFVSSALQNEDGSTRALHDHGYTIGNVLPQKRQSCWANPGGGAMLVGTRYHPDRTGDYTDVPWRVSGAPAVAEPEEGHRLTVSPEWTVAVDYLKHEDADPAAPTRPGSPRAVFSPTADSHQALAQYLAAAGSHNDYAGVWGAGKEVVGLANFGDVAFHWGSGDDKAAVQTLWWRLPGMATVGPLTRYVVDLGMDQLAGPLYGGFVLRDGDHDGNPPRYDGVDQPAGTHSGYVADVQHDLLDLGFALVGTASGTFDKWTRWAVRELQSYAKGGHVARDTQPAPMPARYSDSLESVAVPADQRYTGPVSGVVDRAAATVIAAWKQSRWRCPVVVEAWTMSAGQPSAIFTIPATGTRPARPADNIWRHDEMRSSNPRIYVRDFSQRYAVPARPPDAANHPELAVLGDYQDYQQNNFHWLGGRAVPASHVWRPHAEMLPEHLLPAAAAGTGPTLAQLVADRAAANADVARRATERLSTYKVVRAVAEVEALGYFDVYNAYDTAFMSCGPCHWTAGPTNIPDGASPATHDQANLGVSRGELWAFMSYLQSVDPAAFAFVAGDYGLGVKDAWGVDGQKLWVSNERKYASLPTLTDEKGLPVAVPNSVAEYDFFRSWHWAYRFAMAGRTVDGYRRRMWHLARQRIRDILNTPWDSPAAGTVATVAGVPTGVGNQTRPARIGDVFTSERAVGMLMRWHVLSPGGIVRGNLAESGATKRIGRAGSAARGALTVAKAAQPALDWSSAPGTWSDAHELALIAGIRTKADTGTSQPMKDTIPMVQTWPQWYGGDNPREFSLPVGDLPAGERNLATGRNSFHLDSAILPNSTGG